MFERKIFFCQVTDKDQTRKFRLKSKWEEDYFQLFVIENTSSWFALVTPIHLQNLARQHDLTVDVYCKNLQEYFCNGSPNFNYDVDDDKFIMYQKLEGESLQLKYFVVDLEKMNYQTAMENILDELVSVHNELLQKQVILKEECDKAMNQKLVYEAMCSDFIEKKNKSDHQMHSAFILLLNEKKQRIQFLTELLEEYECGRKRKYVKQTPVQDESKPSTSTAKETISDSESETLENYSTDDEKNNKVSENDSDQDSLDLLGDNSPPVRCLPIRNRSEERISSVGVASTSHLNLSLDTIESEGLSQHRSEILEGSDNDASVCTQELLDDM